MFRFRNIIVICVFVSVFMATFGTCYAVKSQMDFKQWPKDFHGLHLGEKAIIHSRANAGVYALWFYFPESNRTIFVALNRMDFSDPPVVDSGEVMMKILSGVRDILWNQ